MVALIMARPVWIIHEELLQVGLIYLQSACG